MNENHFNRDYALGFVMKAIISRKSGCLESECAAVDMMKSKTAMEWLILKQLMAAITCAPWRRISNPYFRLKCNTILLSLSLELV